MRRIADVLVTVLVAGLAAVSAPAATAQAAELVPLPAPGKPVVSNVTATGATLTWEHSAGPVFRYSMRRLVDGVWQGYASMPSNTITLTGLTPGETYTMAVQSHALVDSGYTSSPLSEPVTFTTGTTPAPSCRIDFWTWSNGYTADGTLTGQVSFTKSSTMTVNQGWNATFSTSGDRVTISANGRFGFGGGLTGPFSPPSDVQPACDIRVNGRPAPTVIVEPATITVDEGHSFTFTVRLSEAPPSNVWIGLRLTGSGGWAMPPIMLAMTPTNWNTPQPMSMMAVPDADTADEHAVIILSASGYASDSVAVTMVDDD